MVVWWVSDYGEVRFDQVPDSWSKGYFLEQWNQARNSIIAETIKIGQTRLK